MSDTQDRPIFVLGLGRSGTTAVQQYICTLSDCWIWGEHSGILTWLAELYADIASCSQFGAWHLAAGRMTAEEAVRIATEGGDATRLAWNTAFGLDDLREALSEFVKRLFARDLPADRRRWGFKEIRYGSKDRVPELLLELFPECRIVHVVRNPTDVAISTMASFRSAEINAAAFMKNTPHVLHVFDTLMNQWIDHTFYMTQLASRHAEQVLTIRIEDIDGQLGALHDFLGAVPEYAGEAPHVQTINQRLPFDDTVQDFVEAVTTGNASRVPDRVGPLMRAAGYPV